MQRHSCNEQFLEREGGADQGKIGGTTSGHGQGWAAVTSWRQPGIGTNGRGWSVNTQRRPYGHQGYGIGEGVKMMINLLLYLNVL